MANHQHGCLCESCRRTERELDDLYFREIKSVTVGEITVTLQNNGKIYISGTMIMTRPLAGLTKENVQDLLVALDGVTNEMPD